MKEIIKECGGHPLYYFFLLFFYVMVKILLAAEFVDADVGVCFAGAENGVRESFVVD